MQDKYDRLYLLLKLKIYNSSPKIFKGLLLSITSILSLLTLTLKTIPSAKNVIQIDVPPVLINGNVEIFISISTKNIIQKMLKYLHL